MTLDTAAITSAMRGDLPAANAHVTRALTVAHPGRTEVVDCCEVMAVVAAERGEPERALRLLGATARIREQHALSADPWWYDRLCGAEALARAAVTPTAARAATEAGARLSTSETVEYVLHGTLPGTTAAAGSPLTEREQRIAELVARGYTNHQIAARLFISNRTVAAHVSHIRAKLGLASRVQIAAWVANGQSTPATTPDER
jgi:non-specific serine/threonine protein kinase